MSQINIGIALFSQSDTSPDPHFSWAIATTSGNWINSEIHTYDIVSTSNGQWEKRERFEDLSHDSHFCGIVEFAHTDLPVEDLDEFIEEHPAEDDGWRVYGPNGWSSAMWALKVMCALEDAAIWDIPPIYGRDALFDLIIGKGFIMLELVEEVEEFPVLQLTRYISMDGHCDQAGRRRAQEASTTFVAVSNAALSSMYIPVAGS